MQKAFTLLELIIAIVIIGVLSAVAIPKFSGLSDNAKISSELSTAASIQVALDACHGEWIINEGTFTCGKNILSSDIPEATGYPPNDTLGTATSSPINRILKNADTVKWTRNGTQYYGPASGTGGASKCKSGKPCIGKYWNYDATTGEFKLIEP
jgi:prepilin-type N-terminal cleavage/methylation domain-containing protein